MDLMIVLVIVLPTVVAIAYCIYLLKAVEREDLIVHMEPQALRILIVDDSETTRRVVGTILRSRH